MIRRTRALTDKPFGVGVILAFPHEQNLKAILDEKVAVVQVYWGECSKDLVDQVHSAGVKIIPQVSILLQITLIVHVHRVQLKLIALSHHYVFMDGCGGLMATDII